MQNRNHRIIEIKNYKTNFSTNNLKLLKIEEKVYVNNGIGF